MGDRGLLVAIAGFVVLAVWLVILTVIVRSYIRKRRRLMGDASIDQLEVLLSEVLERLDRQGHGLDRHARDASDMRALLEYSLVTPHVVRYNAFDDIAGSQSFTLALLDRTRTGLILTSLVGREGGRLYVKPIRDGACEATLSDEEEHALRETLAQIDHPGSPDR